MEACLCHGIEAIKRSFESFYRCLISTEPCDTDHIDTSFVATEI